MASINYKKILIYSPFAVAALYGGYLLLGYFKEESGKTPNEKKQPSPPKPTKKDPIVKDSGCTFPLKKGMTNDCIKQLQAILDVTPQSGYFGSKTEAALLEQTGKKQIDSLQDLNETISEIIAHDDILLIQRQNKGNQLISTYNDLFRTFNAVNFLGSSNKMPNNIYFMGDTSLYGIDDSGNSFVMYMSKGKTLSLNDYAPTKMDEDGNLILVCNKGLNAGEWTVLPDNLTIQ